MAEQSLVERLRKAAQAVYICLPEEAAKALSAELIEAAAHIQSLEQRAARAEGEVRNLERQQEKTGNALCAEQEWRLEAQAQVTALAAALGEKDKALQRQIERMVMDAQMDGPKYMGYRRGHIAGCTVEQDYQAMCDAAALTAPAGMGGEERHDV